MGAVEAQVARAVVVVVVLVGLAGGGCRSGALPAAPFTRALVAEGPALGTPADEAAALRTLERLAGAARAALAKGDPSSPVDVLNRLIFDDERFDREVDDKVDKDLKFLLLPSVLSARRGSCVGLGTLYLALGELLTVPMRGVVMPGHFYVRAWDRDRWRNVELLRRGEELPDDWYRARWPVDGPGPAYGRPLTDAEVLGVVAYDVGNEQRRAGQLAAARRSYERAVAGFPTLAEAQASLGAVLHLAGALDAAAGAYQAAKVARPRLPGLDENLRLLEQERDAARAAHASPPSAPIR